MVGEVHSWYAFHPQIEKLVSVPCWKISNVPIVITKFGSCFNFTSFFLSLIGFCNFSFTILFVGATCLNFVNSSSLDDSFTHVVLRLIKLMSLSTTWVYNISASTNMFRRFVWQHILLMEAKIALVTSSEVSVSI